MFVCLFVCCWDVKVKGEYYLRDTETHRHARERREEKRREEKRNEKRREEKREEKRGVSYLDAYL